MKNLIVNICYWIINKLTKDKWVALPFGDKMMVSKDNITWFVLGISMFLVISFVGCSTHKHCGTAHYSELTSQDYENAKRRMETNDLILSLSR